jgi:hypothetical protein
MTDDQAPPRNRSEGRGRIGGRGSLCGKLPKGNASVNKVFVLKDQESAQSMTTALPGLSNIVASTGAWLNDEFSKINELLLCGRSHRGLSSPSDQVTGWSKKRDNKRLLGFPL